MEKKEAKSDDQSMTLEEVFGQLEEIVGQLQSEDTPLEESMALYAKGVELLKVSNGLLESAEAMILKINEEGNVDEL